MFAGRVQMSGDPIVPVVIDTNVLVPSLYSYTPIAQFMHPMTSKYNRRGKIGSGT